MNNQSSFDAFFNNALNAVGSIILGLFMLAMLWSIFGDSIKDFLKDVFGWVVPFFERISSKRRAKEAQPKLSPELQAKAKEEAVRRLYEETVEKEKVAAKERLGLNDPTDEHQGITS